jgi:hypothetical protein
MGVEVEAQPKTGEALFSELLAETIAQQKIDGNARTERVCDPVRSKRDRRLTEKWQGTAIAARVIHDGASILHIKGAQIEVGGDTGDPHVEPVQFPCLSGVIESVSTGYGGFIALKGGGRIALSHCSENGLAEEGWQSGLEIEVVCDKLYYADQSYTPSSHPV